MIIFPSAGSKKGNTLFYGTIGVVGIGLGIPLAFSLERQPPAVPKAEVAAALASDGFNPENSAVAIQDKNTKRLYFGNLVLGHCTFNYPNTAVDYGPTSIDLHAYHLDVSTTGTDTTIDRGDNTVELTFDNATELQAELPQLKC